MLSSLCHIDFKLSQFVSTLRPLLLLPVERDRVRELSLGALDLGQTLGRRTTNGAGDQGSFEVVSFLNTNTWYLNFDHVALKNVIRQIF